MKKILLTLVLSFGLFAANANAEGTSVGIIDIVKINKEAEVMKSINNQKAEEIKKIQKEVNDKKSELEAKDKELKSKQALMDKEAFVKEVRSFQMEIMSYEQETEKKVAEVEKAYIEALQSLQKNYLNPIVKEIGQDKGFDLVINSQTSIVLNEDLDITDDVIDALDDQVTEIDLDI